MKNALIIGSEGSIGAALTEQLAPAYRVSKITRKNCDYTEEALAAQAKHLATLGSFDLIICCIGVLHNELLEPEKRLSQLDGKRLLEYYRINSVLPALCIKAFSTLLKRPAADHAGKGVFIVLSAMVGSITDNQLGGWYGYRSSKAATNMLVKTAAIEIGRQNKQAILVAMHPGTTVGPLSKPFAGAVAEGKYYTPAQTAARIITVAESLDVSANGQFINWDGRIIPW